MDKLTRQDFELLKVGNVPYLSYKGKNVEICIESGFGCIDIAVYDLKQELLEPKVTMRTSILYASSLQCFYGEIDILVNKFYQKWELKL